jgi:hypothetical protein
VRIEKAWSRSAAVGAFTAFAALALATPAAQADPEMPVPPPPPPGEQPITVQAAPGGDPVLGGVPAPPPAEVPHLFSPENLPPGTSDVPVDPPQGRGTSYLRDLWHAVQTQEISGRDALLLLTQRPLDPDAMPTNGMPTGPQAPPGTPPPLDAPAPDAPPPGAPAPAPLLPGLPPPTP